MRFHASLSVNHGFMINHKPIPHHPLNAHLVIKDKTGKNTPDLLYLLVLRAWGYDAGMRLRILAASRANPKASFNRLFNWTPQKWDRIYNGTIKLPKELWGDFCRAVGVSEQWLEHGYELGPITKTVSKGYSIDEAMAISAEEYRWPEFLKPYFTSVMSEFGTPNRNRNSIHNLISQDHRHFRSKAWYMAYKDGFPTNPSLAVDLVCSDLNKPIPQYIGEEVVIPLEKSDREEYIYLPILFLLRKDVKPRTETAPLECSWRLFRFVSVNGISGEMSLDMVILHPGSTREHFDDILQILGRINPLWKQEFGAPSSKHTRATLWLWEKDHEIQKQSANLKSQPAKPKKKRRVISRH